MKSITIKPVIYAQYRRKDGTLPIRMRVTFSRASRFLTTNLSATADQLTRGLKIKDPTLARKADALAAEMRDIAAELNYYALATMSVDDVVAYIAKGGAGKSFALDFPTYADQIISRKGAGAKNYRCAMNSLAAFIGRDHYDISVISSSMMERWQAWLEERHGIGARAVSMYTSAVAYIHGRARAEYNNEEAGEIRVRNPFAAYRCPRQMQGTHRNSPPAVIGLMLLWRDRLKGRERLGVDVFLLSFALMGMNAPDLYECARPTADGIIIYNRRKTRSRRADAAEMRVRVEPCIAWLVAEYRGRGGRAFSFADRYGHYKDLGRAVNIGLGQFSQRIGLAQPLTLYVARHDWATIARSRACNIDKSVVNDCICHIDTGMRVTDTYAAKDWAVIWEANARVLRLFDWQK